MSTPIADEFRKSLRDVVESGDVTADNGMEAVIDRLGDAVARIEERINAVEEGVQPAIDKALRDRDRSNKLRASAL